MKNDSAFERLFLGVQDVIVRAKFEAKLKGKKKLRIKHGVDPTTQDLHLGYAVVYEKLRILQEMGHTIVFLIGSFTGRFGDPTDKSETRAMRSKHEVLEAAVSYKRQLGKILDTSLVELRENGEWYDTMRAEDLLQLMSRTTTSRMMERDMFQERIKEGKEVRLHELAYPLLQGWDSVELKSDATVIGSDQTFNELMGRELQQQERQAPQDLMIMPLLVGTDGVRKMSQSLGNHIGFDDAPEDMYGKVMSIADEQILTYFTLVTRKTKKEIDEIASDLKKGGNPRNAKAALAYEIVKTYHHEKNAKAAAEHFERVFTKKGQPAEMSEIKTKKSMDVRDLIVTAGFAKSKSEAQRLVEQGAVKVGDKAIKDWKKKITLKKGDVLQVGKRHFARIQ
ncbi:MAG: tyrosine--tRNA ligase [Patescibacteria group bacterium]|jgi:tyrosyl-tRNA synthetase